MIKSLRTKFIIISMSSMFLVLFATLGIINGINYSTIISNANNSINGILSMDNGPLNRPNDNEGPIGDRNEPSRFFAVTFDNKGNITSTDTSRALTITDQVATTVANDLYKNNKIDGFYDSYWYRLTTYTNSSIYVFIDCHVELNNFNTFLHSSIGVGVAGFLIVYILIYFFSKWVFKPIESSYQKQKQFITDAGHELKTPLTIISANTDIIEMEKGQDEWTSGIKEQVERLSKLVQKLIFLAKLDENQKISMLEFNLSSSLNDSINSFLGVANSKNITINSSVEENILYTGNEDLIKEVFSILFDNAFKSTDGNYINVSLKTENNKKVILFSNKASYLEEKDLNKFFDRFNRGDSSRNSEKGGHGIGLSILKVIIDAHKGKVNINKVGDDIEFKIIL